MQVKGQHGRQGLWRRRKMTGEGPSLGEGGARSLAASAWAPLLMPEGGEQGGGG